MVATMIAAAYFAAGTFAYTATVFAVNFALSMIVTRLFTDAPSGAQDNGVRQQVPPSAANAIPVVYGDAYMGGTFVDAVLSTDQKTMYYVLAISSISPNGQFTFDTTDMYYGDRKITFDVSDTTKVVSLTDEATPPNVDTKVDGNLFIYLYRSNAAGVITPLNSASAPSTVMGGADIAAALRWSGTRQMNGLGFAIVKLIYNRDADTTQLSPITFKVKHYLNGAGVAKPGDVWYDYMTSDVYGGAVPVGFVDASSATALNAYSDQVITFDTYSGPPSTQARYRINGVLDAGQTVLSNVDKIVSACDSWMTYSAALGKWSIVINKAETASYAFNDNNIVGEIRVSATDITSSINQIEAKFPFKENRDQPAFVNLVTPDILLYPNEPENKYTITYDLVNDSVQAQYLANRLLEQAREDLIVSFSTTYYGIQVDAGDVVSVTNSNYGWTAKLFRVNRVNEASLPDGSLGAKLELSEYSAAVYDDANIRQYTPVANSGLPSVSYFSPLSAPTITATNAGSAIPNFTVQTTIPATGRVTLIELYYTDAAIPTDADWSLLATANLINTTPLIPSSNYVFENLVLPTGADPTKIYYFAYTVSNDISTSFKSAISSGFTWSPVAARGPEGPAGANGLNFINAYRVQNQADAIPTFTTPTSGAAIPAGWVSTTPAVSVGQVLWYIQGRNNNSTSTIDGVAANTTAWTGPIAASVFQDIRSDNWNGSNPPSAAVVSSWGTTGYYISRNDGNMYANGFYARGVMKINGSVYNPSLGYTTALDVNPSAGSSIGVIGYTNVAGGFGVVGWTENASALSGVNGTSTQNGSDGVLANNTGGGFALNVAGKMKINNNTLVTNLNANFVNGVAVSGIVSSGSGVGTYLGTTKPSGTSTNNQWLAVVISGTTYYIPAWQ
jgi:hypothetical protein